MKSTLNPDWDVTPPPLNPREPEDSEQTRLGIRILKIIVTVSTVLIGTLSIAVCCSIFWMLQTWNNLSMEELVFHLKSPLQGTNASMIWSYVFSCGLLILFTAIMLSLMFVFLRKHKLPYYIALVSTLVVSGIIAFLSISHVWNTLDVTSYNSNQSTYSTFIDDNYVDPKAVDLAFPEEKRNLIYIFLESMEVTYADESVGGAFEENVIPELTQLALDNECFNGDTGLLNGGTALQGAGWTVAAMFAQTSGLPLLIPIGDNSMDTQDSFFPGITSLGDILQSAGYNQGLLVGSEAEFGGRKLYFEDHGDYDIWDYNYYSQNGSLPEGYRVWWGYEDKRLFEFAKEKITEMSKEDEPFNMTMLTVDTHFPDGYPCEDCPDTFGDNQYANVMACSSQQVEEFVDWIKQQDFYENTTIVISGDHPTMDDDFCIDVSSDYQRKVYTTYINAPVEPKEDAYRDYSTFDDFPSTLASLGVEIEGDRLGLGTNLFSDKQTLSERFGNTTINAELLKKSLLMEDLTANISEEELHLSEQEQEEEVTTPSIQAEITTTPYNYRTGKFTVEVDNISTDRDIKAIRCAVWHDENQADLQWYEATTRDNESYTTDVRATDFFFETGEYEIHVYALDAQGQMILIGETTESITE